MKSTITGLAFLVACFVAVGNAQAVVTTYMQGLDGYQGTNDTTIRDNTEFGIIDINFNNTGNLQVSRAHTLNPNEFASVVRFDDLNIPAGSTINSVTLRLSKVANFAYVDTGYDLPGVQMDVAGLLVDFGAEGIGDVDDSLPEFAGVDGGPTGNNRRRPDVQDSNTFVAWNTPLARSIGTDYNLASYDSTFDRGPVDASITGIMAADGGYHDFDVTTSFTSQYSNDKMYGWVVHGDVDPDIETDGQFLFRDSEFQDANPLVITKPQLVVDFTPITGPGDFDFDGDVDGNDLLIWQRGLGTTHTAGDLTDWENNYPSPGPAVGAGVGVPEPASLALLVMGVMGFTWTSRRSW